MGRVTPVSTGEPRTQIVQHPAVLRELRVATTQPLGDHARTLVLEGSQLGPFTRDGTTWAAFSSPGPEDHVKLILPSAPGEPVVLPDHRDGKLVWPDDPAPTRRDVSVRHFDPAGRRLTIEVVLHGGGGPLAGWADRVAPGDRIHLTGPRSSRLMPTAGHFVLLGDLASLAAVARWTAETPAASTVTVRVVVPGPADERRIDRPDDLDVDVEWIHGTDGDVLLEALAAVDLGDDPFVFVGAENAVAKAARTFLRDERGLPAGRFRCIGYWRRD